MAENWMQRTVDIKTVVDQLGKKYDIEQVCSGDVYATVKAMMALAVNQAVNETGLSPRKKKRIVLKMADWLMNGAVAVFMLGYDVAKKEHAGAQ